MSGMNMNNLNTITELINVIEKIISETKIWKINIEPGQPNSIFMQDRLFSELFSNQLESGEFTEKPCKQFVERSIELNGVKVFA